MSSIGEQLVRQAAVEVESGGLTWRVRPITTAALLEVGKPFLLAARRQGATNAEDASSWLSADPKALADGVQLIEAAAAAGTIQVRVSDGEWEDCRLVLSGAGDPARNIVPLWSLPAGTVPLLGRTALELALGKEGGAPRPSFQREGSPAPRSRRPGRGHGS